MCNAKPILSVFSGHLKTQRYKNWSGFNWRRIWIPNLMLVHVFFSGSYTLFRFPIPEFWTFSLFWTSFWKKVHCFVGGKIVKFLWWTNSKLKNEECRTYRINRSLRYRAAESFIWAAFDRCWAAKIWIGVFAPQYGQNKSLYFILASHDRLLSICLRLNLKLK